ncbi:SGNH/GDSL hydrolase family protein [Mesorhizobium sp.]|uniref:SGNH/GDSL hydrolase family protein n=1 Tax=Mesorhizobium sp. TaxID=1871066 RepID=UPI001212DA28|nr:SGNH/GDSL hydrolase family protein [Mesorhizobium sp.]TIP08057.1 MAG: SGNH/GDSL hydrolase family protein [Mesorhizobium sp.]
MARPATAAVRLLTGEREPVRLATTANIILRSLQAIDGVPCEVGDRVLVKDQADQRQNGIYTVSEGEWFRAADARTARTLQKGTTVHTQVGTVNADRVFEFTADEPALGSDAITIAPLVPPDISEVVDQVGALKDATVTAADAAAGSAMAAAANAGLTAADRLETAAAVVATAANVVATAATLASAQAARDASLYGKGIFPTIAAAIGLGIVGSGAITAGSGGTNGTFDLAFTGGAGSGAAGRFVVAGGVLTQILITAPGSYTVAPSFSFAASAGLAGAAAAVVLGRNVDVGEYFWTEVSTGVLGLYNVTAGPVATDTGGRAALADAETLALLAEALQYDDSGVAIAFDVLLPAILIKDAASPAKRYVGSLLPLLTSSRSTAAWYFDRLGLLRQAGVNTPRFTYDYKSLAPRGLLCEPARVNRVLWNRDLTNAAWTKSNMTAALDQVGLDGIVASASSITATADDATVLQPIVIASAAYFQTAYIRRLSGAGAISMTMDGGATWTDVTPPDAYWNRMSILSQTLANPNVGFKIATSGDSFAIDLVQNENGNYKTSPMVTTTAFFSRGVDLNSIDLSTIPFDVALGALVVEGRTQASDNVSRTMAQIDDATAANQISCNMSSLGGGQFTIRAANAVVANVLPGITVVDKTTRLAASWGPNYAQAALDGSVGAQDNALTVPSGLTRLRIGSGISGTTSFGGTISRLTLRLRTQDGTELTAMSNFGPLGVEPLINIVPNDSKIEDSDYAATLAATTSQVSGVRPVIFSGYQYANPGWRRRFKTRATSVVLHFQNLNLVGGSYNAKGQILVNGVHNTYFTSPQALGKFFVRLDFSSNADRLIEIVMPYSASIAHLGITTYGAPITLPTPRSTLPRAVFLGDSRFQGFNATSIDKHWTEILCRAKGWEHINLGYGSSGVTSAWGTDLGNADPNVAFVMFDYNNRTAQTALLSFKNAYKALIDNFRAVKPTTKLYAVTSNWISTANDALTLKIADYRQATSDALTELADANNILIDGLTLTTNSTASIGDGIHPNDVGEAEWAANIAPLVSV